MPARDELARIEASTDWSGLVDLALGDPPKPRPLFDALTYWGQAFRLAEAGEPAEADYPEPVRYYFQRLLLADYPPAVWNWLVAFKRKRGRPATLKEIPKRLRATIPTSKRGPPRCDTRRFRAARRAWEVEAYGEIYEQRRDMIRFFRRAANVSACFGLNQESMLGDTPSNLALELVADEAKISPSRLDQMGIRRRNK